jgi:DNA mismatch endonuclease, patch repair protein
VSFIQGTMTRAAFWKPKIEGNRQRDREVGRVLRKEGWTVTRLWEHSLTRKAETRTVRRLRARLMPKL